MTLRGLMLSTIISFFSLFDCAFWEKRSLSASNDAFSSFSLTIMVRVAILDDYQHVAFTSADWAPVRERVDITVFDTTIQPNDEDALVERLKPFEIICSMRERTKFPASLLKRLPNLKLLTTTGMRNAAIDLTAATEEGVLVSGTGYGGAGTSEHK